MPFYTDDIYNHSVSTWFMSDFFKTAFDTYHYARFPFTMYVVMGTLKYFFDYPIIAHLLLFTTHGISILILCALLQKYFRIPKYIYFCMLILLFSLNSNVENLLWFAAIHENISLMFSAISIYLLVSLWEAKNIMLKVAYFSGTLFFQLLSVASSEVGYLLFLLHPPILFLISFQKLSITNLKVFIKRSIIVFPMMAVFLIVYRIIISKIVNLSLSATPYQFSFDPGRFLLFSQKIVLLPIRPITDLVRENNPLLVLLVVITAVFAYFTTLFSTSKSQSQKLKTNYLTAYIIAFGFFCLATIQIIPHALVAITLGYNFPRYSYLYGIFISLTGFIVSTIIIQKKMSGLGIAVKKLCIFSITLVTCIYVGSWIQNVLLRIPVTRNYIRSFELDLSSKLSNNISKNSFVLFSFIDTPPHPLVSYIRQYDFLQWNHGIIGYFNSGFIKGLPENVSPMPLDGQNIHNLDVLNITLTGSYWVQYGNDPQAVLKMISDRDIQQVSHYYYDGFQLNSRDISNVYLYNENYTEVLNNLIHN